MPDHHVEAGHGVAVERVDCEPGRVADDVEARVRRLPLLGQATAQQTVDLDPAVELFAQVLPAGVGDAQAQGQLEHRGGVGTVDGSHGGGGMPLGAVLAEVTEQSCVEQSGGFGAPLDLAQLPGVQREGGMAVGQRQFRLGQACGELRCWDRAASFGPGGVGGEDGRGDSQPVQREGAAQLG